MVNIVAITEIIFPGPISFLSRKDYLLIPNTSYEIECYSFNNLASSIKTQGEEKKVIYSWVLNLGELVKEIRIVENKLTKKQEILVLCETTLHLIDDNGKLLFQKKLNCEPMAIYPYSITDPNYTQNKWINIMYMISTDSDHLLIYKGLELAWAVKYDYFYCRLFDTPVFITIADFNESNGLIVTLSDQGKLSVMYLGMEQVKNNKIMMLNKNIDMESMINETQKMMQIVGNFEKGIVVMPKYTLVVKAVVDPKIYYDEMYYDEKIFYMDSKGLVIRVFINV